MSHCQPSPDNKPEHPPWSQKLELSTHVNTGTSSPCCVATRRGTGHETCIIYLMKIFMFGEILGNPGSRIKNRAPSMAPKAYDPSSENEKSDPLPSAPIQVLAPNVVLQPPLTRRGTGPGIVLFLPDASKLHVKSGPRSLDPEPVQKWAEEGFAVVAVTAATADQDSLSATLRLAIGGLLRLQQLDIRDTFAVIVYDNNPRLFLAISGLKEFPIACLLGYGIPEASLPSNPRPPTLLHLTSKHPSSENTVIHVYPEQSGYFVFPQTTDYDPGSAAIAHTRSLVFLRKWLGGPNFDIEAIWEEHCYFEHVLHSVAKTVATMVQEPYVHNIPTMTGGFGRAGVIEYYRDQVLFSIPDDASLQIVSRTVGPDRIVDEFVYHATHDRMFDWLLPGVPPTGKKLSIPMVVVVNVRGDRLSSEQIWWDQATVLRQAGILPTHVPYQSLDGSNKRLRLPVAGAECAHMLLASETIGRNNEMLGTDWGVQE